MLRDLLNRAASKDWQVYAQLQTSGATASSPRTEATDYKGDLSGMTDESELNRLGYVAQPVGEVLYDSTDQSDLVELGYMLPNVG